MKKPLTKVGGFFMEKDEKAPDEGRGLFLGKRMKKPLTKVGGFFMEKDEKAPDESRGLFLWKRGLNQEGQTGVCLLLC